MNFWWRAGGGLVGRQPQFCGHCGRYLGNHNSFVYLWGAPEMRYFGFTRRFRTRRDLLSGPVARLLEHLTLTHHPDRRDGGRKRYKLARRTRLEDSCSLVMLKGSEKRVLAAGTLLVNINNTNGNNKKVRVRRHAWTRRRRRRGQVIRKQTLGFGRDKAVSSSCTDSGPLDSAEGRRFVGGKKVPTPQSRAAQSRAQATVWDPPFGEATREYSRSTR